MRRKRTARILQVDAFTDKIFGGNPAIVILDADKLTESNVMQIQSEMGTGQTVFIYESEKADFRFRYMTPGGEMDFSGHLTIAGFTALIEEGLIDIVKDMSMFLLETRSGILQIEVVRNESSLPYEIQITHEKAEFKATYDPLPYAEALGLSLADILSASPLQTVSTGTPQLMIPVANMNSLKRIDPNWKKLIELQKESDWVSIQVFTRETIEPISDVHVRHFAPSLQINEDPVTGSAAGSMCSYMIKYGILSPNIPVTSILIEQGYIMDRPGKIIVEVQGDPNEIRQVKVSGTGVIVMKGLLYY